jgi:hypothetical protein
MDEFERDGVSTVVGRGQLGTSQMRLTNHVIAGSDVPIVDGDFEFPFNTLATGQQCQWNSTRRPCRFKRLFDCLQNENKTTTSHTHSLPTNKTKYTQCF